MKVPRQLRLSRPGFALDQDWDASCSGESLRLSQNFDESIASECPLERRRSR